MLVNVSRRSWSLTVCVALLAVAGLLSAQPSLASSPTAVTYIEPVDSTGHLDTSHYKITSYFGGADCYPDSQTLGDIAYRCFTDRGSYVLDPCFAGIKGPWYDFEDRMYCLPYASSTSVTDITAPFIEDTNYTGNSKAAWAVQRLSGYRCAFHGGMSTYYQGHRLNWVCNDRWHTWLIGSLNKTYPTWTAAGVYWNGTNSPHDPFTTYLSHAYYARVEWCEWC